MAQHTYSPEEVLLLPDFTAEELEQLTPGELRLLVALDHEELPTLSPADARRLQQEYRGRVISRMTEVEVHGGLINSEESTADYGTVDEDAAYPVA